MLAIVREPLVMTSPRPINMELGKVETNMEFMLQPKVYRLLTARFFDGISSGMFMMALPWIMLTEGDNGPLVASIALMCTLSSFFLTPFFSTAIDRYSRKRILLWLQIAQAATALALFLFSGNGTPSFVLMGFAQLVFWLSTDFGWNTNNALTQENFSRDEYARISSYQEVIMQGVMLGAGAAGVILLEQWDMQSFALLAFFASALGAGFYAWMPYARQLRSSHTLVGFARQMGESKAIFQRDPRFMLFLAMSCLSYPVLMYLVKLVPIYLAENNFSGQWFALWKSSYGIGAMVCGFFIIKLMAKYSHEKLMIHSVLMISAILMVMALLTDPLTIVLMTLAIGFFNALNRIARTNKMNHEVDINERGRIDGGLKMFSTLSQSLGYTLIVFLASYQLTEYGFWVIAIVMGAAGLYMYLYQKKHCRAEIRSLTE